MRDGPLPLGLDAVEQALAVSPNRISAIVNGTRTITADTALRLGKYFGTSPEIWLDLQSDYELRVARRTVWSRIESGVRSRVARGVRGTGGCGARGSRSSAFQIDGERVQVQSNRSPTEKTRARPKVPTHAMSTAEVLVRP
ncbi:MAG: HigA family addiction module antidote protein [Acidobacteria bacterium]|nr:HigA family addiction module antidote protein [Acidobacteriota bacterium]